MSFLWLIIKIILFVLLGVFLLLLALMAIILLAPVRYEVYFEKYEEMAYDIRFSYLGGIKGRFQLDDGIKHEEVRAFWKVFHKRDTHKECLTDKDKKAHQDEAEHKGQIRPAKKDKKNEKRVQTSDIQHELVKKAAVENKKSNHQKAVKLQKLAANKGSETVNTHQEKKKNGVSKDFDKSLLFERSTYQFVKEAFNVFFKLIKIIAPYEWDFELVVGRGDPADTGETVAKLTMLYPLYYRHGVIRGDYERKCLEGGLLIKGKFRLVRIFVTLIVCVLKPSVIKMIKKVMN